MKRKYAIDISLLLSFIIIRLLVLMTSVDLFDFEELEIATLAKEVLHGSTLPYLANMMGFQMQKAGMLINGTVIAGFYKLFGESWISLKLCWLFFSIGTYIIFSIILKKYFNYRIFVLASCFFILCPPIFTWYNLTSPSVEVVALFLIAVITFLNFKMLPFGNNKIWHYILYGFSLGLAISFSHYCLFILFVSLLYQLWYNRRFFLKKSVIILLLSFFGGLGPWILLNKCYHLQWFEYILYSPARLTTIWSKLTKFFADIFPHSLYFKDLIFIKGITLGYTYYFLCIALLAIVICSSGNTRFRELKSNLMNYRNRELFIYLYIVIYILVFVFYNPDPNYIFGGLKIEGQTARDYRYLLILYPFIFVSMAIWVDRLLRKKTIKKMCGIMTFLSFCVLGLLGNLSVMAMGNFNFKEPSIYTSHSFSYLIPRIYLYARGDKIKLESYIDSFQTKYKPYSRHGVYKKIKLCFISKPTSFLRDCKNLSKYQDVFYEGMGISIGRFFRYEPVFQIELTKRLPSKYRLSKDGILSKDVVNYFLENFDSLETIGKKLSKGTKNFYYERVGLSLGILLDDQIERFFKFVSKFEDGPRGSLIEGFASGLTVHKDIESVIKMNERIDADYRKDYFEGVGFIYGLYTVPNIERIMEIGNKIETSFRDYYYRGIGRAVGWHFTNDPTLILKLIGKRDVNFVIRQYSFLTIGMYQYLDIAYKKAYCRGLGYGIAPHLSGFTAVVLEKLEKFISLNDYLSLLEGVCYYHRVVGVGSFNQVFVHKLAQQLEEIYRKIYGTREEAGF